MVLGAAKFVYDQLFLDFQAPARTSVTVARRRNMQSGFHQCLAR